MLGRDSTRGQCNGLQVREIPTLPVYFSPDPAASVRDARQRLVLAQPVPPDGQRRHTFARQSRPRGRGV
jgi:hypothetical protein